MMDLTLKFQVRVIKTAILTYWNLKDRINQFMTTLLKKYE